MARLKRLDSEAMDRSDDVEANFEKWIEHAAGPLRRSLRRWADSASVDDIMQDVFLRLYQRRRDFESSEHLLHYAQNLARWRAIDLHRKQSREVLIGGLNEIALVAGSAEEKVPDARLTRDELEARIARLSGRGYEVLTRMLDGKRPEEIGAELGITPATVRSLARRARYQLASQDLESEA